MQATLNRPAVEFRDVEPLRFVGARSWCNRPEFLEPLTEANLCRIIANGGRVRLSPSESAGYVVKPDGTLSNVFNVGRPGMGAHAVNDAIRIGAKTLDCFDGFLTRYYAGFGFREFLRVPFDPQLAPSGWDYERYGRPDVVFMAL